MKYIISIIIAVTFGSFAFAQESASTSLSTTSSTEIISATTSSEFALSTSSPLIPKESKLEQCEIKIKLNQRKDRVSGQIQKQLADKNKLVDTLMAVASSSEEEIAKDQIRESVIKLETDVLSLIKSQRDIINIIASTTETPCASSTLLKRENDKSQLKIKKISIDIEKKSALINSYIKNDIRELISAVKE